MASMPSTPQEWQDLFQKRYMEGPIMQKIRADPVKSVLLPWLEVIEIVEAVPLSKSTGRVVVRFPVQHEYLNVRGTLQGGLQTAMFDIITSWVFAFVKGWEGTGTSRTITTAYLRPAFEGEMLLMEAELVQAGKRMGLSKGVLMREKDRAIISTCEHHKYNMDADTLKL